MMIPCKYIDTLFLILLLMQVEIKKKKATRMIGEWSRPRQERRLLCTLCNRHLFNPFIGPKRTWTQAMYFASVSMTWCVWVRASLRSSFTFSSLPFSLSFSLAWFLPISRAKAMTGSIFHSCTRASPCCAYHSLFGLASSSLSAH